jgi:hypothetical protein
MKQVAKIELRDRRISLPERNCSIDPAIRARDVRPQRVVEEA